MNQRTVEIITRLVLVLVVLLLGYWLYAVIREPIVKERRIKETRSKIIERLKYVREAESAYKELHGKYTGNWDSLINTVKYDSFTRVKTVGDPNDTTIQLSRDTTLVPIKEDLFAENYPIDSIQYSPNTGGKKFNLEADMITERGVNVNVFEAKDVRAIRGTKLKVGSLTKATTSGNWQ